MDDIEGQQGIEDNEMPMDRSERGVYVTELTVDGLDRIPSNLETMYYIRRVDDDIEGMDSEATEVGSINGSDSISTDFSFSDTETTTTDTTLVAAVPTEAVSELLPSVNEPRHNTTAVIVEGIGDRSQHGMVTTIISGSSQELVEPAETLVVSFQSAGNEAAGYIRLAESDSEITLEVDRGEDNDSLISSNLVSPVSFEEDVAPLTLADLDVASRKCTSADKTPSTEPSSVKRMRESPVSDDEGQICSICFEPWTNSGSHRLSSLRCGHLFGQSCITKWLKGKNPKCPQCNMKARPSDIRVLYAKSVKVVDTTDRDRALQELEREREARRRLEVEMAQTRLKCQLTEKLVQELEKELKQQQMQVNSSIIPEKQELISSCTANTACLQMKCEKIIEVCKENGGRVMASCDFMSLLVASKVIPHNLFPGYGVRKINTADFNCRQNIFIHTKCIRDMAFNPVKHDGILLTASMDKTVRLTSMLTNSCVQVYHTDAPSWSVAWNDDNNFQFFVGLQNGFSYLYDTRQTHTFVQQIHTEGSRSPAASLQYVKLQPLSPFSQSGLLVTQFDRCVLYEIRGNELKPHFLPLEGPFMWASLDQVSRHFLVSCRPSAKHLNTRHLLCELTSATTSEEGNVCSCNVVNTFEGGSCQALLARSILMPHPQRPRSLLACAGDETSSAVMIWDVQTTQRVQKLPTSSPVLDVLPIGINDHKLLATLGTKDLSLYRFS